MATRNLSSEEQLQDGDLFTNPETSLEVTIVADDITRTVSSGTTHSGNLYQSDLILPDNQMEIQVRRTI